MDKPKNIPIIIEDDDGDGVPVSEGELHFHRVLLPHHVRHEVGSFSGPFLVDAQELTRNQDSRLKTSQLQVDHISNSSRHGWHLL